MVRFITSSQVPITNHESSTLVPTDQGLFLFINIFTKNKKSNGYRIKEYQIQPVPKQGN